MPSNYNASFPDPRSRLPLTEGDWVIVQDKGDEIVAVVVERNETAQGRYVKVVPVRQGSGRPFWIAVGRCRRVPPSGDGGM